MKRLIITNGTGGAGKDTFCKYVTDYLESKGYTSVRGSYVDYAKWILSEQGINTSAKTDKDRQLLAGLNKLLEQYDDLPFRDSCQLIDNMLNLDEDSDPYNYYAPNDIANVVLFDVRDPSVIERFKSIYENIVTVLVDNGTTNTSTTEDSGVFGYRYDCIISNTRELDYLKQQAENFTEKFILKGNECIKKVVKT